MSAWQMVAEPRSGVLDWLDGIGSFVAGAAALLVLLYELDANRRRRKSERKQSEFSEASRLTWWLERNDGAREIKAFADAANPDYSIGGTAVIVIHNGNPSPLYRGLLQFPNNLRTLGSDPEPGSEEILTRQLGILPPGESAYLVPLSIKGSPAQRMRTQADIPLGLPVKWVEFRDGRGKVWRRLRDGKLQGPFEPGPDDNQTLHAF